MVRVRCECSGDVEDERNEGKERRGVSRKSWKELSYVGPPRTSLLPCMLRKGKLLYPARADMPCNAGCLHL